MSFAKTVWKTLSAVDVGQHIEKKGQLSYLSWAWAWGELMNHFPESDYEFKDLSERPDGSAEVSCVVSVKDGDSILSRSMWLPVMDNRNNSVSNPTTRQISDTKMRCLVKCLAMFGLGHYIYAGEDLPQQKPLKDWIEEFKDSIEVIQGAISAYQETNEEQDLYLAAEEWWGLSAEAKQALWVATSKGGPFTTKERELMKSTLFRTIFFGEDKTA